MIYWDSSAIVALLIEEKTAGELRTYLTGLKKEVRSATCMISLLEIESAIQRRLNQKVISSKMASKARLELVAFKQVTTLIPVDDSALEFALHYQRIHELGTGDALQLAALRICRDHVGWIQFMCLDKKLSQAAYQEGFQLCLSF